MRVLHACSEVYPLLKTGGLADVTGALPPALQALGCDVRMLLPGFPAVLEGMQKLRPILTLAPAPGASDMRLLLGALPNGIPAYVIDAPDLYDRPGNPYADDRGDNHRRFAPLGRIAAQLADGLDHGWRAQIVHSHDWHAALAPAYLKAAQRNRSPAAGPAAASVQTIHNLAYQGVFDAGIFQELGLPPEFFNMHGVEYYGHVSFLKAGLYYADRLTTVSPSYAREIQQPEQGCGLEGLLRTRAQDLHGILNGVDYQIWHPATDRLIERHYHRANMAGKRACRHQLQRESGLRVQDTHPVFGVVSRLTEQKGLHLLLAALPRIVAAGGQLVLLGSGDAWLEQAFREAALRNPDAVAVEIGYHEARSHRVIAGADLIVVPSRFEPCGLTQLYGLAYATLPLVRRVGGLADTVTDCTPEALTAGRATGFVFDEFSQPAFEAAIDRAFALFEEQAVWQQMQQTAMQQNFGWDDIARQMLALYRELVP